jgi:DNA-binding XRE family transcriptional regulator
MLSRKVLATQTAKVNGDAKPTRYSAKGLQAQRSRVGLSQTDCGKRLGVSAQSIYNWEAEKARPRAMQIAKLAALRSVGKREVAARLAQSAVATH